MVPLRARSSTKPGNGAGDQRGEKKKSTQHKRKQPATQQALRAYNSHHAPSVTAQLLAGNQQLDFSPVLTFSLIEFLGVSLAISPEFLDPRNKGAKAETPRPSRRRGFRTGRSSCCQGNAARQGACSAPDALAETEAASFPNL